MPARMTIKDNGYKKLMEDTVKKLTPAYVKVGVFGEKGSASRGNITNADIGANAELGIGQPQRPWLSGYVDETESEKRRQLGIIAKRALEGKSEILKDLDVFGAVIVGEIQERISAGIPPENSERTKARKGSSTPLIDTGQFRSSITHEVVKGRPSG